ncbi:hypothetical protein EVAR_44130_1 [Eumeta japonica]|uniref:Mariner Mos1 transposase n=1 Tax=Eumeta variegata TaxID=151549 RepID=A0A4C1XP60_EUMVA|nr:hypothetical protein EVAR_44130_1 [Eumeta japonica]
MHLIHTAWKTKLAMTKNGFKKIDYPPYSLDLARCDYFLFRLLKKHLRVQDFQSYDEMKSARLLIASEAHMWPRALPPRGPPGLGLRLLMKLRINSRTPLKFNGADKSYSINYALPARRRDVFIKITPPD